MQEKTDFFRRVALGEEQQMLPASVYNSIRQLLRLEENRQVKLPIKSLQSIAVITYDEIMFVDIHMGCVIEFSWQDFKPQARKGLECPVSYRFVWYNRRACLTMQNASIELEKAVLRKIQRIKLQGIKRIGKVIKIEDQLITY